MVVMNNEGLTKIVNFMTPKTSVLEVVISHTIDTVKVITSINLFIAAPSQIHM